MNLRAAHVLLGLFLLAGPVFAEEQRGNYIVWQGVMRTNKDGEVEPVVETDSIPYVTNTDDPTFSHGFIVRSEDGSDFKCQVKVHFSSPTMFRFSDGTVKTTLDVEMEPDQSSDGMYLCNFTIDEGDPAGPATIDILINGELWKTIAFTLEPRKP